MTLNGKVNSRDICKTLNVELLAQTEKSQLRWFGYVTIMPQERLAKQVLLVTPTGEQPKG